MAFKLIAFDMDETLLNDNHEICQRNIEAIKKAKEQYGIKFVPATGRGYLSIQHDLKTLGLYDEPGEYVISFNGGAITENKGNRLLQFRGLDFYKMKEIFEFGLKKDVCMHVYTKDKLYVYQLSESEKLRLLNHKLEYTVMEENTVDFLEHEPISKILYQNLNIPYLRSLEPEMAHITDGYCTVSYSSNRYMEFNAIGVDKGQGLRDLAKILGIDLKDTIAVGDNYNDLAMLKTAGLPVAAGNAVEEIKKVCSYTTKADNNEGVVAELIEKFIFR
ncbi:Cof-type HAD-IIB family hydrolase [Weizmannia acidilactici]|uniref:Cof-type HAD-IIB family hydrolase n=1 Tax=Weizmannia acidilactici TaxID=2607726 RepID=UPI00124ED090|nr:Cof-type HAD-IIB family hydrolase [Weizmannia acidilactici]GER66588.1 haloacid dehalogenase [Weizmannia acidilactici]GER73487.1 haloacid dehalogenase [Weizmannia acidilactici]